jgi:hypothetical protein
MNYKIRKFTEAIEVKKFKEAIDEVKKLIEGTIEKSGGEFNQFIDSYVKSPNDIKIEGLIDEKDIFDFYLKYRNQIDECLQNINFYDETPGVIRLYDYIIKGTTAAILEFVKSLSTE